MQIGTHAPEARLNFAIMGVQPRKVRICHVSLALRGKDGHDNQDQESHKYQGDHWPRPETHDPS